MASLSSLPAGVRIPDAALGELVVDPSVIANTVRANRSRRPRASSWRRASGEGAMAVPDDRELEPEIVGVRLHVSIAQVRVDGDPHPFHGPRWNGCRTGS